MKETEVKIIPDKNLYIKKYDSYKIRIKKECLIALISDIHFINMEYSEDILNLIGYNLLKNRPDIICLTGDLINDAKQIMDEPSKELLLKWLKVIVKVAPVYLIKGNHDLLTVAENGKGWQYYDNKEFFDKVAAINNLHLLSGDNKIEEFNGMTISGFDLGDKTEIYYEEGKECKNFHRTIVEPQIVDLENKLDPKQFNILLFHSPENLYNILGEKYSLILSGHMHNGLIPNAYDAISYSNRGIIAPVSGLFPAYARGCTEIYSDTTGIIASPVTTIAGKNNSTLVRKLYKPGIQYIYAHK